MSSPARTTFEIKVANKLKQQSIWVKIAAELNYATQLQSSSSNHQSTHASNKRSGSTFDQKEDASSTYNNNKSEDKSSYGSSSSNSSSYTNSKSKAQSSDTNAELGVKTLFVDISAKFGHKQSKKSKSKKSGSSSSAQSNHGSNETLIYDIYANSQQNNNTHNESFDNSDSYSNKISTQQSQSAVLTNKTLDPGFVRIIPLQSLPIPVIVESESQVVYITVYCFDKQGDKI
eukprot:327789_1